MTKKKTTTSTQTTTTADTKSTKKGASTKKKTTGNKTTKGAKGTKKGTKKSATKSPAKKKSDTNIGPQRDVIYPEVTVSKCFGKDAMTADQAQQLLGWEETTDDLYNITDFNGKKIRLLNNAQNRPYYASNAGALKQEILRKQWSGPNGTGGTINGEAIVIGKTGLCMSAQHRLVALVLASQEYNASPEEFPEWDREPVLDTLLVQGVDEDDAIATTFDTGKPQSLSDVIYRSEHFRDLPSSERSKISRALDYATRLVWGRTGAKDQQAQYRTHAESLQFIDSHPTLVRCVKHVYEENGTDNRIGKFLSLGNSAGLMYLMAACKSDPDKYAKTSPPTESALDLSMLDKAEEFFVHLGNPQLDVVTKKHNRMKADGLDSIAAKLLLLIKAWNCFAVDKQITSKLLNIRVNVDEEEGIFEIIDTDTVGGIDLGDEPKQPETVPSEAQVEHAKKVERATKEKRERDKQLKGDPPADEFSVGDNVWVEDPDGEHFDGELTETYDGPDGLVAKVKTATGEYDVLYSQLRHAEPAK